MLVDSNIKRNGIKNCTNNGECSRCGSCCGLFIPFTEEELNTIREYVSKHNILPTTTRINKNQLIDQCCFYDSINHKCNIYEVRPFVCRDFKCNNKDWKERRDKYEARAKYNSTLSEIRNVATFDDLIYKDYTMILMYAFNSVMASNDGNVDTKKLLLYLKLMNRLDLLEYFEAEDENGNKIKGTDLLKEI